MVDPKDEEWLKKLLGDCFDNVYDQDADYKNLEGFRILVSNLLENINKEVDEIRKKLSSLEKHLFYLRRFCKP